MALLTINPDVENYVHEFDWKAGQIDGEEMRREIVSRFEDGQLVILKNHPIKIESICSAASRSRTQRAIASSAISSCSFQDYGRQEIAA